MKSSLATSISIVGVLAAGAAAFAVNTAVLNVSPDSATATVSESSISNPTTNGKVASQNTPSPTVQTIPSQSQAVAAGAPSVAQTSTYKVGESGRVILEVRDGSLRVANVLPSTNWNASRPEYEDGEVEVKFYSGAVEVEFKARLVNGEIAVFVQTENNSTDDSYEREYHDDDDDDDDHEDDEHERDDD